MRISILLFSFTFIIFCKAFGQQTIKPGNLYKRITLQANQEKLSEVLTRISTSGNFYFSYNGKLFKPDGLVSLSVQNIPVITVLDKLFKGTVDYRENGNYIILRPAPLHLTIEPDNITTAEKLYLISGYVIDTHTRLKVKQASVYDKRLLQSALTDNNGYFKLRFKGNYNEAILTASKEGYKDSTLIFLSNITIKPEGYYREDQDNNRFNVNNMVEKLGIGRFLISSKQRIQSLNIPNFLANSPFQASITPGLSSHGMMSAQVVNKGSLNLLGGYTAGLDGYEMAGLFNMSKGDVKYVQVAGLFNVVGGGVKGLQAAGLMNSVIENSIGVQVAGLLNDVRGDSKGLQTAGLFNHSRKNEAGVQVAGLVNIVGKNMSGIQIGGLFNFARQMRGVQIGLINVSDSSSGYSIGLINISKHGYHKISLSANEVINTSLSLKLGNDKLYSLLIAGQNFSPENKIKSAGFGLGHDLILNKTFSAAAEVSSQFLYLGNWEYANMLSRAQLNLQIKLFNGFSIFGGPAYVVYHSDAPANSSASGYKQRIAPDYSRELNSNTRGWLGWNAGITFF